VKRAALYHRVSTTDQNPALARVELRRAARARSLQVALYEEERASAGKNDRAGLRRVLEAARRHRVDVVMVWKIDRFGRSLLDLVANVRQLREAGIRFVSTSQGIDLGPEGNATGELQFNILSAVAEFERELIRERTALGLAAARRAGKRLGRPSNAPPAAAVGKLRAKGWSWPTIAKKLNRSVMQCRRAFQSARS
jgi:DNA invertase Pin-like site-specific DNA recombinase